jgi:hypothetical protein
LIEAVLAKDMNKAIKACINKGFECLEKKYLEVIA